MKGPETVKALTRNRQHCNWKPGTSGSQRRVRSPHTPRSGTASGSASAQAREPRGPRVPCCSARGWGQRLRRRSPALPEWRESSSRPERREDPTRSPHARRRRKVRPRRCRAYPSDNSVVRGILLAGRLGCLGLRDPRPGLRRRA